MGAVERVVCRFVLAAASLGLAGRAQAYVRTRSPDGHYALIWRDPRVTMTVQMGAEMPVSVSDLLEATSRAMAAWSAPANETSVALSLVSSTDPATGPAFDRISTLSFRTSGWDPPRYGSQVLALTTVWSQRGVIVDADVEINGVLPPAPWALLADDPVDAARTYNLDLQGTLTHELGHVLGLAHPCYLGAAPSPLPSDNRGVPVGACSTTATPAVLGATMFPSAAPGEIRERQLSDDERQALRDLYPKGQDPVVDGDAPSVGGCAMVAGSGDICLLGGLAAFLLLAPVGPRRRPLRKG